MELIFLFSDAFDYSPKQANNLVTIYFVSLGFSRATGIYYTRIIKPSIYIFVGGIGTIIGVSIILGMDYASLANEGSEGGLIAAIVIFSSFNAVS